MLWPETVSRCQSGSRQQYLAWAGPRPGTRTGAGPGVGQQGAVTLYRYSAMFTNVMTNVMTDTPVCPGPVCRPCPVCRTQPPSSPPPASASSAPGATYTVSPQYLHSIYTVFTYTGCFFFFGFSQGAVNQLF